jgi:7-carboxy-7-deazaguanine synthase
MASDSIVVCETFVSLCGETTRQGLPAWFVRLGGCHLRCVWCDTQYAWSEGERRPIAALLIEARRSATPIAVVTGGEPLEQTETPELIAGLCDLDLTVLVETNGTQAVAGLDPRAVRILDVKPPSARVDAPFLLENLAALRTTDELKFVIADREDFDFAQAFVEEHDLAGKCHLLLSPAQDRLEPALLADWLLDAPRRVFRLQLQLHKQLWGPAARGR